MSAHSFRKLNNIHNLLEVELNKKSGTLEIAQLIADLNNSLHSGRYFNLSLELFLSKLTGNENENLFKSKSILYIATELYPTGGHTRYFENLLDHFLDFSNDLIITNQSKDEIPKRITDLLNVKINSINSEIKSLSSTEKIRRINKIAANYEYIVLNIHPTDIITIAALSNLVNCKIIFINHADHKFWVGNSIIDTCINIRPYAAKVSKERRAIKNNVILPIPVKELNMQKKNARSSLGISGDQIVILTVSSLYKIIPNNTHNFFKTIYKIVELVPSAIFYLIGVNESSDLKKLGYVKHPRIKLLGEIEDPSLYQSATDIYIEGFPYNSFTACLETVKLGAIPVLHYAPMSPMFNMETELAFDGKLFHSDSEENYLTLIKSIISNLKKFQEKNISIVQSINYYNGGDYWKENIAKCFNASKQNKSFDLNNEFSDSSDDIELHNIVQEKNIIDKSGNLMQEVFFKYKDKLSLKLKINIIFNSYPFQYGKYRALRFIKFIFTFLT